MFAQMFLQLTKQAGRKTGLLLEVCVMKAPLVFKEGL